MEENNINNINDILSSEDLDGIFKEITNIEKPKLSADWFMKNYYKVFRTYIDEGVDLVEQQYKEDKNPTSLFREWSKVSKNHYSEVVLVDKAGKEVVTLPGIMARPVTNFSITSNMSTHMSEFNSRSKTVKAKGESYFMHNIAPSTSAVHDVSTQHTDRWRQALNILEAKYGIKKENKQEEKNNISKESLDDLGFE